MRVGRFIAPAILVGTWTAPGCVDSDESEIGARGLANTLSGQGDILVASSYRDIYACDNWAAAVEALQNSTFVVSYVAAASPYRLYFRRYSADPAAPGFVGTPQQLDINVTNVRRAGTVVATEGDATQAAAWLTWDYHYGFPGSGYRSVSFARIRQDGTVQRYIDFDNGVAPSGAVGQTAGWPSEKRVLIAYVSGSFHTGSIYRGQCGTEIRAAIFDATGTEITSTLVDSASLPWCFSSPSVVWNNFASRFEVVYHAHKEVPYIWWRARYVRPDGVRETTPHDFKLCSDLKSATSSAGGVLTENDCHRHSIAFDTSSSRNATHRFARAYYGDLLWHNQDWTVFGETRIGGGGASASWVDVMPSGTDFSYRAPSQRADDDYRDGKYYDTSTSVFDQDGIGSRPCSSGHLSRGECYHTEAMARSGLYAAILYSDYHATPRPLFLSVVDTN